MHDPEDTKKYMIECGAGQSRLDYEEPPFEQLGKDSVIG